MKMLSRLSFLFLATAALSLSARGDELETPQMGKLTPQMQARLRELLGAGEVQSSESGSNTTVSPSQTTAGSRPARTTPASTALRTGSLRTGHLMTSGSLTGAPRLNEDEWRQLFPQRK